MIFVNTNHKASFVPRLIKIIKHYDVCPQAHCRAFILSTYKSEVERTTSTLSEPLKRVLNQLVHLYAVYWALEKLGDLLLVSSMQHKIASSQTLESIDKRVIFFWIDKRYRNLTWSIQNIKTFRPSLYLKGWHVVFTESLRTREARIGIC